jgi:hypothetical protein
MTGTRVNHREEVRMQVWVHIERDMSYAPDPPVYRLWVQGEVAGETENADYILDAVLEMKDMGREVVFEDVGGPGWLSRELSLSSQGSEPPYERDREGVADPH